MERIKRKQYNIYDEWIETIKRKYLLINGFNFMKMLKLHMKEKNRRKKIFFEDMKLVKMTFEKIEENLMKICVQK